MNIFLLSQLVSIAVSLPIGSVFGTVAANTVDDAARLAAGSADNLAAGLLNTVDNPLVNLAGNSADNFGSTIATSGGGLLKGTGDDLLSSGLKFSDDLSSAALNGGDGLVGATLNSGDDLAGGALKSTDNSLSGGTDAFNQSPNLLDNTDKVVARGADDLAQSSSDDLLNTVFKNTDDVAPTTADDAATGAAKKRPIKLKVDKADKPLTRNQRKQLEAQKRLEGFNNPKADSPIITNKKSDGLFSGLGNKFKAQQAAKVRARAQARTELLDKVDDSLKKYIDTSIKDLDGLPVKLDSIDNALKRTDVQLLDGPKTGGWRPNVNLEQFFKQAGPRERYLEANIDSTKRVITLVTRNNRGVDVSSKFVGVLQHPPGEKTFLPLLVTTEAQGTGISSFIGTGHLVVL